MTINSAEYRTSMGLDSVYIAKITQDDADGFIADTPVYLAPAAEISGAPTVNETVLYYDDTAYETVQTEGKTERKIKISNLPAEMEALLLGEVFDAVAGRMYDRAKPANAPYFALGYRALKSNGSYKYYWWAKGKFTKPATDHATQGESPDPKAIELTYNAVKTIYQFDLGDVTDGIKRVVGDEDTTSFDPTSWFATVQTPDVVAASAITCSPSPADAATGVAISANVVLTFNNRIRTGAAGIVLMSAAGAVIAAAYTWDTAVKVLTINPNSNLSGSTTYLVALSGVTDIYGQTLANTVYDFTTV